MDNFCICGCGLPATRGKWVIGHWNKGKKHPDRLPPGSHVPKIKKTHEERSEIARKMWDERGRVQVILNPCACGCEKMVKGKWAWGHHSRVQNISKRDDIREMRRETFIRLHKEGKMPNWNHGLTAKTDERVFQNSEGLRKWNQSEEGRKFNSEKMREDHLDGTIRTRWGPESSNWKGGTSAITQCLRANGRLYKEWKRPILKRDEFSCMICKKDSTQARLAVHHDKERFADILKKFLPEDLHELSWDESTEICERAVDYHVKNSVSGVTLCYGCHKEVHQKEPDVD